MAGEVRGSDSGLLGHGGGAIMKFFAGHRPDWVKQALRREKPPHPGNMLEETNHGGRKSREIPIRPGRDGVAQTQGARVNMGKSKKEIMGAEAMHVGVHHPRKKKDPISDPGGENESQDHFYPGKNP